MEPADELGPQTAQVVVALGEQSHDLGVVGRLDAVKTTRAQGGNGNRERIVGIVLLRTPRAEHPDPRGQGGWDVEDNFAGIDELLGQQITETTGGLDGPGALGEGLGPGQQLGRLLACRPHRDLGHSRSSPPMATAVWLALWDRPR